MIEKQNTGFVNTNNRKYDTVVNTKTNNKIRTCQHNVNDIKKNQHKQFDKEKNVTMCMSLKTMAHNLLNSKRDTIDRRVGRETHKHNTKE